MSIIISNPGGNLLDEFVSISFLVSKLAENGKTITVYRQAPTDEEISDEDVFTLGAETPFDAALKNLSEEKNGWKTPTFKLLLRYFDIEVPSMLFTWLESLETSKNKGTIGLAAALNVPALTVKKLSSPAEAAALAWLESHETITDISPIFQLLKVNGDLLWDRINFYNERVELLKKEVASSQVEGQEIFWVPDSVRGADSILGVDEVRPANTAVTVSPDPTGPGYSVYKHPIRTEFDFRCLDSEPDVTFVHPKSYLFKTVAEVTPERIEELLRKSKK